MDAGQPDSNHSSAILSLIAAKENTLNATLTNHIDNMTVKITADKDRQTVEMKIAGQKCVRPNINVTTNPLDMSLIDSQTTCNSESRGRGKIIGKYNFLE